MMIVQRLTIVFMLIYRARCHNFLSNKRNSRNNLSGKTDQDKKACSSYANFNKKQNSLCIKYPDLMDSIIRGAKKGVKECGVQLSGNRWNCSNVPDHGTLFGPILPVGCRESAFLFAITSAAVAHSITTACSSGLHASCGCGRSLTRQPSGQWEWRGCHSNVKFAGKLTKEFSNTRDSIKGKAERKKMNRHNIRAGIKILSSLLYRKCKCHGVSGSCDLKTCWMQQPKDFGIIGKRLLTKYVSAVEMVKTKLGPRVLRVKKKNSRGPRPSDLIYYQLSPNFCDSNWRLGTIGTFGRVCNITSTGFDSCRILCCGRGYNVEIITETVKCNCRFQWCCRIECENCIQTRELYTCK